MHAGRRYLRSRITTVMPELRGDCLIFGPTRRTDHQSVAERVAFGLVRNGWSFGRQYPSQYPSGI